MYSELRIKNNVIEYQKSSSYPPVTQKCPLKIPVQHAGNRHHVWKHEI